MTWPWMSRRAHEEQIDQAISFVEWLQVENATLRTALLEATKPGITRRLEPKSAQAGGVILHSRPEDDEDETLPLAERIVRSRERKSEAEPSMPPL